MERRFRKSSPRVDKLQIHGGVALELGADVSLDPDDDAATQIKSLSAEEVAQLRAWFAEFDWALWDQQLERDVAAGKLDVLAEKALRDHAAGETTPL